MRASSLTSVIRVTRWLSRIENHYFFHRGWFAEGQLIANAGRLADIPGS